VNIQRWTKILLLCLSMLLIAPSAVSAVTIDVWTWLNPPIIERMKPELERFTAETGIKVNMINAGSNAFQLREKLLVAAAAGAEPDVSMLHLYTADELIDIGLVRDITPYMRAIGTDFQLSDVIPGGFIDSYRREGKIYGLPFEITSIILYYNKTLFDQAGLNYPDENWRLTEEFMDHARKLTIDLNGDGSPDQFGLQPGFLDQFIWRLWDTTILTPDRSRSGWHDPRAVEAWEFYGRLYQDPPVVGGGWPSGKAGMMTNMNHVPQRESAGLNMDWDLYHLPLGPDGVRRTRAASSAWCILDKAKHPDEAAAFLRFLVSAETQWAFATSGVGSVRLDTMIRMWRSIDPVGMGFTPNSLKNSQIVALSLQYAVPDIYPTNWSDLWSQFAPLLDQIRRNLRPVRTIVEEMSNRIDLAIRNR